MAIGAPRNHLFGDSAVSPSDAGVMVTDARPTLTSQGIHIPKALDSVHGDSGRLDVPIVEVSESVPADRGMLDDKPSQRCTCSEKHIT